MDFFEFPLYWFFAIEFSRISGRRLPKGIINRYVKAVYRKGISLAFYEDVVHIKSWKDKLPEISKFNKKAFDKSSIASRDINYLEKYRSEILKGIFIHSFPSIFMIPIVIIYYSRRMIILLNFTVLTVIHIPFIMILRYNLYRIDKLLNFKNRRRNKNSVEVSM